MLFADLAGFTALSVAHGDADAAEFAARFRTLAEGALVAGAHVVKMIGDAAMIVSSDPRAALDVALALLRAVDHEPDFPGVRAGLHSGPVVERAGDYYGATVNIAARLTEHAHIGQLVTTSPLVALVVAADNVTVQSLGPTYLKHVPEPIDLFSIEEDLRPAAVQVLDPVCRMFVDADRAPAQLPWNGRLWHFCSFNCAAAFSSNPERYANASGPI